MKAKIFVIAISILFHASLVTPAFAQTQGEMNYDANLEYEKVDAKLNEIYTRVIEKHKDNKELVSRIRESQRAWLKFRDAEVAVVFLDSGDPRAQYGSAYPMCYSHELTAMTNDRIEQLSRWLDAQYEGDVCAGTRENDVGA